MRNTKVIAGVLTVLVMFSLFTLTMSRGGISNEKIDGTPARETYMVSADGRRSVEESALMDAQRPVHTPLAPGYCTSNGGSTAYEYISSINYTKNPSGTMIIAVEIFIANPTGCTYGDPCPEYDSSPEYVNAWVDWDGDTIFESHERVINDNLTGYHDLNYFGTMTTSMIVTIPSGAVNTTWMRVNLGWNASGYDPCEDPCTVSWAWGDVFDEQVSTETNLPQILDISVRGPPGDLSNPMTTQPVTVEATMSTVSGYTIETVSWSGDGIPAGATGNPYSFTPAAGTHGIKNVQCAITYEKTATGETGEDIKAKSYKLFFVKSGDEDGDGVPNWFEHWATDGAVPGLGSANYNAALGAYGQWTGSQVELGASAAGQHYGSAIVLNTFYGTESFGGPAVKGIDCAAEVIAHERNHAWVDEQWASGGIFHGQTDSDKDWQASEPCGSYTCYYRDELPDFYENTVSHTWNNHSDTYDLEHLKSGVYRYYGDQEYMCLRVGNGTRGDPARDWANPGKQSTPAYGAPVALPLLTASGPAKAAFTGYNEDEGTDTDGDSLFNYLTVSTGVEVDNGGLFTLVAWLNDAGGDEITFVNEPLTLANGTHVLPLNFSGRAIRDHGVNGTFNVTMVLSDDDDIEGSELDHQTYTTAAYNYTAFQAPHAHFNGTFSHRVVDSDDDKFYNYLNVTIGVHVRTTGTYTLKGWLYDPAGEEITASRKTATLTAGEREVILSFDGAAIRQHGVDGPYCLKYLALFDGAEHQIGFIYQAYCTAQAYPYDAFEPFGAEFTGGCESYGVDTNMNKLYDYLAVEVGVRVFTSGNYTVASWLYDKDGNALGQTKRNCHLTRDTSHVTLRFRGKPIFQNGMNGPYYLKYLTLYDESGAINDQEDEACETSSYNYKMFQPLVLLTDYYQDKGEDADHDGLYENLRVCIELLPSDPGNCVVSARLLDRAGREILWAHASAYLEGNEPQLICLEFDGRYIFAHQEDGPFTLGDVYVYHTGDVNVPDYAPRGNETDAYKADDFERAGIITGKVTSTKTGKPISGAVVSIEGVDYDYTDAEGTYLLTILTNGTYLVEVEPPMCSGVLSASAFIAVNIGEKVVHDFELAAATQAPDLVITSKVEHWVQEEEGMYTVSYTVKNVGALPALKGHNTTLYIDDEPVEHKLVPVDLNPCETYADTFETVVRYTSPGDKVVVCADNYQKIEEADELNNCFENAWKRVGDEQKPDLEIDAKWESWRDQEKATYVVHYKVHNNGTATALNGHNTTLYVNGKAIEHRPVPVELQPCQTYEDTFSTVVECTRPGDSIWVCADNFDLIDELDETDNCMRNTLSHPKGAIFDTDTPATPYPSIAGWHNGTLKMNQEVYVTKLYIYACPGTGGHAEYVRIWGNGIDKNAPWEGYDGDWQNLTFDTIFLLEAGKTYNYTILTGSYPQIIHAESKDVTSGQITCEEFVDVNGKRHEGWIPAIKLY
jgi:hypothetical protein